jgi:hypothetical protein
MVVTMYDSMSHPGATDIIACAMSSRVVLSVVLVAETAERRLSVAVKLRQLTVSVDAVLAQDFKPHSQRTISPTNYLLYQDL